MSFTRLSRRLLRVAGPIDEADVPMLRWQLHQLIEDNRLSTVNLTEVTYLPAAAMGAIAAVRGCARRRSRHLDVRARCDSETARLLTLAGLSFDKTPLDSTPGCVGSSRWAPPVERVLDARRVLST